MWTDNTRNAKIEGGSNRSVLNGYENIDSNIFFEIKESKITRGHNYTLVKKQSRLDVRKYSFSQRTINVWNNLSTDCVHASIVNMFKNKIDKYLVKGLFLSSIVDTYSCGFCGMWCLVRVEDNWWVESGLGRV